MINVNDIKNGMTVKIDNNIYTVVEFQHVKPGKGSAFVRTKLKNIRTGATTEITFNAGVKIETARVEKQNMQFLYSQGDTYYFIDNILSTSRDVCKIFIKMDCLTTAGGVVNLDFIYSDNYKEF